MNNVSYTLVYLNSEYYLIVDNNTIGSTKSSEEFFILDRLALEKDFPIEQKEWSVKIEWWFKDATYTSEILLNLKPEITDVYGNPLKQIIDFYDGRIYVKIFKQ